MYTSRNTSPTSLIGRELVHVYVGIRTMRYVILRREHSTANPCFLCQQILIKRRVGVSKGRYRDRARFVSNLMHVLPGVHTC